MICEDQSKACTEESDCTKLKISKVDKIVSVPVLDR